MTYKSHQASGSSGSRNLLSEDALKSPKANNLFLNRPLVGNGSSTSINDMPSVTSPNGIRAQLGHLLPRHAYFRAKVVIHQVSSVPFVSGEFGVRWKFKGVQATPTSQKQGLLGRVKARAEKQRAGGKDAKGEDNGEAFSGSDLFQQALSSEAPIEDGHVTVTSPGGGRTRMGGGRSASGPAPKVTDPSIFQVSKNSQSSQALHSQHFSLDESANSSTITMIPTPSSNSAPDIPSLIPASTTPARGMTPFLKLKDHSVVWSQTLDAVLKFDIDRESLLIHPNPLKLVVMQRVIPDDPHGSPQNPRLGAVYLNLAEYVGQGSVERRYLLKESKTNATLKLTIEMEHISGETHYVAPPLAKGEILNGIAGFLEKDVVKRRPRPLDIYGPYKNQEELEIDLLGGPKSARVPKTAKSERKASNSTVATTDTESEDEEDSLENSLEERVAFDVQRLPVAYGTKTTETLIEALFNPVKISDKAKETPFTSYEPPSPSAELTARVGGKSRMPRGVGLGMNGVSTDRDATIGRRQGSMTHEEISSVYSTESSSASAHTHTSSSSHSRSREHGGPSRSESYSSGIMVARSTPEGRVVVDNRLGAHVDESSTSTGGVRGWWRRNVSRPDTPTARTQVQA